MCIQETQQVGVKPLPRSSSVSASCNRKAPIEKKTNSSSIMTSPRTLLGLSICGISFWLLGSSGGGVVVEVYFLPESTQQLLSLSQQHPQQKVLFLLVGHLLMDLFFSLNPTDSFRSTEIAWNVVKDFWTFVIVVGLLFLTTYYGNFAIWNSLYMNWALYGLVMDLLAKQFRYRESGEQYTKKATVGTNKSSQFNDPVSVMRRTNEIGEPKEAKDPRAWLIHGHEYDLSDFVDRHPGGKESILLGRGRDCTAMFESYHAFTNQHRVVLQKIRKQEGAGGEFKEDVFYKILRERVTAVLLAKGVDPYKSRGATPLRVSYYLIIIASVVVTGYYHIMGSMAGSFWFAMAGWLLGGLGHDAGHFAVSRMAWVNEWGVWGMSLICNPVVWQHQHTYSHHSFTNEFEHDPDLHHFTQFFLRAHDKVPYTKKYQFQSHWLYIMVAYMFTVYGECINLPFDLSFTGVEYSGALKLQDKDRPGKAIGYRLHFVAYFFIVVIIPVFTHESIGRGVIAALVHMTTVGFTFAMFSQINHITEDCMMAARKNRSIKGGTAIQTTTTTIEEDDDNNKRKKTAIVNNSWAVTQVETSNNFATDSWIWHVLSNGLNLQIEHHLFPGLNHCHLHHIAPTVRETCEEYGVNYKCATTWTSLWNASLAWYEKLSIDEETTL